MLRAGTGAMPGYGYQGFPTPSRFELRQTGSVSSYSRCVCVPSLSYFTPVRQICATVWRPALLEKGIYRHLLSLPSLRYGRPQSTMMREETNKVRRSDVARRSAHFRKWIEVGFLALSPFLSSGHDFLGQHTSKELAVARQISLLQTARVAWMKIGTLIWRHKLGH